MNYSVLKKGKVYVVWKNKKTFKGKYLRRWFNTTLKTWHYTFKSLDGFTYFTPIATEVTVWRDENGKK